MTTSYKKTFFAVLLGSLLLTAGQVASAQSNWRGGFTQMQNKTSIARTSSERERVLQSNVQYMADFIEKTVKDTPPMVFFAEAGLRQSVLVPFTYPTGKTPRIKVTGVSGNVLRGTLLLPVSGHTGAANARQWAKTDRFDVTVAYGPVSPDSGGYYSYNSQRESHLVRNVLSLDLVTALEVEIPLKQMGPNQYAPVTLYYYRLGVGNSMGAPGGYYEGRAIGIDIER